MTKLFPDKLYRYRALNDKSQVEGEINDKSQVEREINAIKNSYLWFSDFNSLNDPTEIADADVKKFPVLADIMLRVMLKDPRGKVAKVMNNRAQHYSSGLLDKSTARICCFSERKDHQAMWAYYAGNFEGICIEYDIRKLVSLNQFCWGSKPIKVTYSEKRLVSAENTIDFGTKTSEGLSALSTKHFDWEHEQEWRMFKRDGSGETYHTSNVITHVYLGSRIKQNTSAQVRQVCKSLNISVSTMSFSNYKMQFTKQISKKKNRKQVLCELAETGIKGKDAIIAKGYDKNSLEKAISKARQYPNAKSVFLINLSDNESYIYMYLLFKFPNGKEDIKSLKFKIKGNRVSSEYNYSL